MPGRDGSDGLRAHHREGRRNVGSRHSHAAPNSRDVAADPWSTESKPSFPSAFRSVAFEVGPMENAIADTRTLYRNARALASSRKHVVAWHASACDVAYCRFVRQWRSPDFILARSPDDSSDSDAPHATT